MLESRSGRTFEARGLTSAPGWCVRVVWPNGKLEHIPGFLSKDDAVRRVDAKGKRWVSEQQIFSLNTQTW
jgi:hypothetical protein